MPLSSRAFSRRRREPTESLTFPPRRFANVLGARMAYIEAGRGPNVLFLHGGIASSVLWRRQIEQLAPHARCVAVDLIGTAESARLMPSSRESYRLDVHLGYLETFMQVVGMHGPITLVLHGWASMVGFALAKRQAARIAGICHMESIPQPLDWTDVQPKLREMLERSRSPEGEHFVMDTDGYFDLATRREFLTPPGKPIIDEYRRTLGLPGAMRQALHTGLNSIPIGGIPVSAHELVSDYSTWLESEPVPKLLVLGEPGHLLVGEVADRAAGFPGTKVVRVSGSHMLPEDSPDGIALLLAQWQRGL